MPCNNYCNHFMFIIHTNLLNISFFQGSKRANRSNRSNRKNRKNKTNRRKQGKRKKQENKTFEFKRNARN